MTFSLAANQFALLNVHSSVSGVPHSFPQDQSCFNQFCICNRSQVSVIKVGPFYILVAAEARTGGRFLWLDYFHSIWSWLGWAGLGWAGGRNTLVTISN